MQKYLYQNKIQEAEYQLRLVYKARGKSKVPFIPPLFDDADKTQPYPDYVDALLKSKEQIGELGVNPVTWYKAQMDEYGDMNYRQYLNPRLLYGKNALKRWERWERKVKARYNTDYVEGIPSTEEDYDKLLTAHNLEVFNKHLKKFQDEEIALCMGAHVFSPNFIVRMLVKLIESVDVIERILEYLRLGVPNQYEAVVEEVDKIYEKTGGDNYARPL